MSYPAHIDFILAKIPSKDLAVKVSMFAKISYELDNPTFSERVRKQCAVLNIITICTDHLKQRSPSRYGLYWWEDNFKWYMMQFYNHLETFQSADTVREIISYYEELIDRVEKSIIESTGFPIHKPPEQLSVEEQVARYKQAKNRR